MRIGTLIRHAILLILGAAWIIPLYLFLINAATPPAICLIVILLAPRILRIYSRRRSTAPNCLRFYRLAQPLALFSRPNALTLPARWNYHSRWNYCSEGARIGPIDSSSFPSPAPEPCLPSCSID